MSLRNCGSAVGRGPHPTWGRPSAVAVLGSSALRMLWGESICWDIIPYRFPRFLCFKQNGAAFSSLGGPAYLLPTAYLIKGMVSGEVGAGKECTLFKWPIYFYYLVSSRLRWGSGNSPRWTVTYLMGKKPGSKTGSNSLKVPRIATSGAGLWSWAINKCDIVMLPMISLILLSLYINPVTLEFGHSVFLMGSFFSGYRDQMCVDQKVRYI